MIEEEGAIHGADGLEIYRRIRRPEGAPGRVLIFVHGLAEHGGRYEHVTAHFAVRGAACWALDLRGHGRSDGRRVHVKSFQDYADDVAVVRAEARERYPDVPTFLVGHSMGGLIVALEALRRGDGLAGAVLSSPACGTHPDAEPPLILHLLSQLVSRLAPGMLFPSDLNAEHISRDPAVVKAYREDPLVTTKVSARWYTSILAAMAAASDEAPNLRLPMLVMQSGDDRLVDPDATRRWAEAAPQEFVEFVVWEGLYHEMFQEAEQEEVFARMDEFFQRRSENPS